MYACSIFASSGTDFAGSRESHKLLEKERLHFCTVWSCSSEVIIFVWFYFEKDNDMNNTFC
jgi:hypothetical protein